MYPTSDIMESDLVSMRSVAKTQSCGWVDSKILLTVCDIGAPGSDGTPFVEIDALPEDMNILFMRTSLRAWRPGLCILEHVINLPLMETQFFAPIDIKP